MLIIYVTKPTPRACRHRENKISRSLTAEINLVSVALMKSVERFYHLAPFIMSIIYHVLVLSVHSTLTMVHDKPNEL